MTTLLPFQAQELESHWRKTAWGYNWDPGTGKTLAALENARRLEADGSIGGLLVVAPNGVHRAWSGDEIPKHLPPELLERTVIHTWLTSRAGTSGHELAAQRLTAHRGFGILLISYDGLMTEQGAKVARRFLEGRPCLLVVDESHMVKAPDAKRTKRVLAMCRYAPYRRILTATLAADKPFDVYSQIKILDEGAWRSVGCDSAAAFRAQFGSWEQRWSAGAGRFYPQLLAYRNLDVMRDVVSRWCSRVRKDQVLSELPPKVYSRRYFELTSEQRRAYRELREEAMTLLSGGELVTAPLVVTRLLRMQQVTSGYLPTDDGLDGVMMPLGKSNPRVRCLMELAEGLTHQAIVWAKFTQDLDLILAALREVGLSAVRYDGRCDEEACAEAIEHFRSGRAQFFVSNPAKGGTGLTLNEAKTMIFYNTGYKLSQRIQAEDRAHRIGQDCRLSVVDIVAMLSPEIPTLDLSILEALSRKRELAAQVQGDEAREWLGL
jgi:hypothetical protein